MAAEKIIFEQFLEAVEAEHRPFTENLHEYLIENGCKVTFEEKKSGYLASYKHGKKKRAIANFIFRKAGMLVRIYGEYISGYPDFLNTLPEGLVQDIADSGDCKRLTNNGCSPKCSGYDFTVGGRRFQKCRYNCFELLVADKNNGYIKAFIENELRERASAQ